jgi:diamine N-acetyltransferase
MLDEVSYQPAVVAKLSANGLPMSTHAVALRLASLADAVTVAALSVQVFLDTYAAEGIRPDLALEAFSEYSADAVARRLSEPSRRFILAESGTGLLAYAEVWLVHRAAPAGQLGGAELVRLYVQPAAQQRGIGRALMERTEQTVRAAGLAAVWLTAWEGNARARAFYAHLGCVDVGSTSHTLQGQVYANRVIAKHLGAA